MSKILIGKVVSTKMQNTVLVEVVRRTPHKLYGKLLKRSKKYKADTNGQEVSVGDSVKIEETKPVSKGKHFKIVIVKKGRTEPERSKGEGARLQAKQGLAKKGRK